MKKERKPETAMDRELRAMKRVAAAIDGLEPMAQRRVLNYVEQQIPWPDQALYGLRGGLIQTGIARPFDSTAADNQNQGSL